MIKYAGSIKESWDLCVFEVAMGVYRGIFDMTHDPYSSFRA